MGTIWVRQFTGGLDVRRPAETSPGGTLMLARDCHLTRGGDIEQRADFLPVYTLPASVTKGLASEADGLIVFGHQTAPTLPAGVSYQRLEHPGGEALTALYVFERYKSKIQAIGLFADDTRYVFYDGARVTDVNAPPNLAGSGKPGALLTQVEKMFVGSGENVFFSAVADSTDFGAGAGVGEGFIVMSTHAQGAEDITGLARYDEYTAVFSRRVIQTWVFDPDPTLSRQAQVLDGTGCIAPRAVTQFGDGDVFYLDLSGIRSLRARDSSNSAATTDIGSPIDPVLLDLLDEIGEAAASRAVGVIEPRDGRFWLAVGDRIFVFSFFTAAKISAWTEYRPGFNVDDMIVWDDRVWLRGGDTIYVYGNVPGSRFQYSGDVVAEAWLPYLDADEPFREKQITGIDAAVRGTWSVHLAVDPRNTDAEEKVATITGTTFGLDRIPASVYGNHMSLRFRSVAPFSATKPATLASAVIHFGRDDEEDSG